MSIKHHCDRCGKVGTPSRPFIEGSVPLPEHWRTLPLLRSERDSDTYVTMCWDCCLDLDRWFKRIGNHAPIEVRDEVA